MHKQPNVIKFNQELTHLIKENIFLPAYLKSVKNGTLQKHVDKLVKINSTYFSGRTKTDVLNQFMNSKSS